MTKWIRNNIYLLILVAISIVPLLDLLNSGLPVTHDGRDHVARIASFYQNLQDGNIIPRWAANLNWGYGHPVLMFLYPLPSYSASFFHLLGFSFVDSVKIVFATAFILSGFTMFLWLKDFLPRYAAFIGALLYIFAPYRFVDLYVRGAIGEHVAFVFPPLVFYFMLKLSKIIESRSLANDSIRVWYLIGGSLSLAGLILSHNAISLMFLPLFGFYSLYLLWLTKNKKPLAIRYLLLTILGFGLSAFFWIPAFFEGKYTLRDIVTAGGYLNNFGNLQQFIYSHWNYGISGQFSLQVGIIHWLAVLTSVLAIFHLFKKKNKLWIVTSGLLIIFIASLFIIEKNSQFLWERITLIQKFQFPWRFLTLTVFSSALLGAIAVSVINKKYKIFLLIFITAMILFINRDYWHARGYLHKPESFYTSIYHSTTDTGESSPIWSVRFMEQVPSRHIEVIGGQATVKEIKRTSTRHVYEINAQNKVQLRENTVYFPGWSVYVDNIEVPIEYQDANNRGVITFRVDEGVHNVVVSFVETKLRLFANITSFISIFVLLALGTIWKRGIKLKY